MSGLRDVSAPVVALEGIWSRVDAARVAMEAAQTEFDAAALRTTLALVLADAVVDGEDLTTVAAEYSKARAAHVYSRTNAAAAMDELRATRGIVTWSVA